jgi:hypothetical protein
MCPLQVRLGFPATDSTVVDHLPPICRYGGDYNLGPPRDPSLPFPPARPLDFPLIHVYCSRGYEKLVRQPVSVLREANPGDDNGGEFIPLLHLFQAVNVFLFCSEYQFLVLWSGFFICATVPA